MVGGITRSRRTNVAVRGAAGWIIHEYPDEFIAPECLNGADSQRAQIRLDDWAFQRHAVMSQAPILHFGNAADSLDPS